MRTHSGDDGRTRTVIRSGDRLKRRRFLRGVGAASVAGFAGCLGDNDDGDSSSAASPDDSADDSPSDNGTSADDSGSETAMEILPSDIALEPDDGWSTDHWDVEIPDDPERAVLVFDGDRIEMQTHVECTGGPFDSGLYDDLVENNEWRGASMYFQSAGSFEPTADAFAEHDGLETGPTVVQFIRRMVAWSGDEFLWLNSDEFVLWFGDWSVHYAYEDYFDGSTRDESRTARTNAHDPFLHVDTTGIVTAVGEVTNTGNANTSGGSFEFGSRCHDAWADRHDV